LLVLVTTCWAQPHPHRVVVELNVPGVGAYVKVLGNVTNLLKAFKGEETQVEIVCHDDGIDLLLVGTSPLRSRMEKLHTAGVIFAACGNTLRGRKIDRRQLLPFVVVVDSGVAEVVRKEEAGWSYIKAAY
jgi:intracellular sulfur oxidation DsrE/DsrF family protein